MKHARLDERPVGLSFDTCTARERRDSGPSASFTLEKVRKCLKLISANNPTNKKYRQGVSGFCSSRCSAPAVSDPWRFGGVCPGGGTTAPAGRSADTGEDPFLLKRDHQNVTPDSAGRRSVSLMADTPGVASLMGVAGSAAGPQIGCRSVN